MPEDEGEASASGALFFGLDLGWDISTGGCVLYEFAPLLEGISSPKLSPAPNAPKLSSGIISFASDESSPTDDRDWTKPLPYRPLLELYDWLWGAPMCGMSLDDAPEKSALPTDGTPEKDCVGLDDCCLAGACTALVPCGTNSDAVLESDGSTVELMAGLLPHTLPAGGAVLYAWAGSPMETGLGGSTAAGSGSELLAGGSLVLLGCSESKSDTLSQRLLVSASSCGDGGGERCLGAGAGAGGGGDLTLVTCAQDFAPTLGVTGAGLV